MAIGQVTPRPFPQRSRNWRCADLQRGPECTYSRRLVTTHVARQHSRRPSVSLLALTKVSRYVGIKTKLCTGVVGKALRNVSGLGWCGPSAYRTACRRIPHSELRTDFRADYDQNPSLDWVGADLQRGPGPPLYKIVDWSCAEHQ